MHPITEYYLNKQSSEDPRDITRSNVDHLENAYNTMADMQRVKILPREARTAVSEDIDKELEGRAPDMSKGVFNFILNNPLESLEKNRNLLGNTGRFSENDVRHLASKTNFGSSLLNDLQRRRIIRGSMEETFGKIDDAKDFLQESKDYDNEAAGWAALPAVGGLGAAGILKLIRKARGR